MRDLSPKFSAAYDLRGDGKDRAQGEPESLRHRDGARRQLHPARQPGAQPGHVAPTRTWTDDNPAITSPQCDLQNVKANGECGDLSNANFGTVVTNLTYDAKTLTGFGKRNFNWEFGTGIQRSCCRACPSTPTTSIAGYGNFAIVDDLAVGPQDFDPFTFTAPKDPHLPDGGGYPVQGFDIKPAKFGVPAQPFVTLSRRLRKTAGLLGWR